MERKIAVLVSIFVIFFSAFLVKKILKKFQKFGKLEWKNSFLAIFSKIRFFLLNFEFSLFDSIYFGTLLFYYFNTKNNLTKQKK